MPLVFCLNDECDLGYFDLIDARVVQRQAVTLLNVEWQKGVDMAR